MQHCDCTAFCVPVFKIMLSRWIVLLICEICFVFSKDVIDDKNCPLKNQCKFKLSRRKSAL